MRIKRLRWSRWRDERGRFVSNASVRRALKAWARAVERSEHVEGNEKASRHVFERKV